MFIKNNCFCSFTLPCEMRCCTQGKLAIVTLVALFILAALTLGVLAFMTGYSNIIVIPFLASAAAPLGIGCTLASIVAITLLLAVTCRRPAKKVAVKKLVPKNEAYNRVPPNSPKSPLKTKFDDNSSHEGIVYSPVCAKKIEPLREDPVDADRRPFDVIGLEKILENQFLLSEEKLLALFPLGKKELSHTQHCLCQVRTLPRHLAKLSRGHFSLLNAATEPIVWLDLNHPHETKKVLDTLSIRSLRRLSPNITFEHLNLMQPARLQNPNFPWLKYVRREGIGKFLRCHLHSKFLKKAKIPWQKFAVAQDMATGFSKPIFEDRKKEILDLFGTSEDSVDGKESDAEFTRNVFSIMPFDTIQEIAPFLTHEHIQLFPKRVITDLKFPWRAFSTRQIKVQ